MSATLQSLTKELRAADAEARKLRADVARLEETFAAMQAAPQEENSGDKEADGESSTNGAGGAVMALPSNASVKSQSTAQHLPPELFDELSALSGEVSHEMAEYQRLRDSLNRLNETHSLGKKKNEHANQVLSNLYVTAGWTPSENHRYTCPVVFKDEASRLRRKMVELLQERNTLQAAMERQNNELRDIISQIENSKAVEATQSEYKRELAEKNVELKNLQDDIKSIRRIINQKEVMITKEKSVDTASKLRDVDGSKRVAQHKLVKEQNVVRQNELAIRHRALQIEKLQRRIELIGDAVGGDDTSGEDRVDAEHVEELRKEIDTLSRLRWESNARCEVLDAEIENLQSQVDGLMRVQAVTAKETKRITKEYKRFTKNMGKEMAVQQQVADKELGDLEADIDELQHVATRQSTRTRMSHQNSKQVIAN